LTGYEQVRSIASAISHTAYILIYLGGLPGTALGVVRQRHTAVVQMKQPHTAGAAILERHTASFSVHEAE